MKILIVGSDLNSIIFAQYIKMQNSEHDVYLAGTNVAPSEYYAVLNIPDNDIAGICDFVKYNQIEFTIVFSHLAVINEIADLFKKEGFPVFAPLSDAARVTYFNSIAKKIMYKLKINTPKFGIFDRELLSVDYVRKANFPIAIKNDFTLFERNLDVYYTFAKAKSALQKIYENSNEKIVIENYIESPPFYVYFITDGYNAFPLVSIERNVGEGYLISDANCEKFSDKIAAEIMQNAIYPLLDDISKFVGNYVGILGLKINIFDGKYYILEFYNNFQYYDLQTFLSILDCDIVSLFYDAANGWLSDKRSIPELTGKYAYTVAIDKDKIDKDALYEDNDFIVSEDAKKVIITNTAATLNYAKEELHDFIKNYCSDEVFEEILYESAKKETLI